jgi:hypothetical protein
VRNPWLVYRTKRYDVHTLQWPHLGRESNSCLGWPQYQVRAPDRPIPGDPKLCGIHCGIMVPVTALRKTLSGTIHGQACLCWLSIKGGYVISYNITAPCIGDGEKSIQRIDRWFSTMFIWILLSRSKQLWSARPTYQQTVGLAWSCFLRYGIQPLFWSLNKPSAWNLLCILLSCLDCHDCHDCPFVQHIHSDSHKGKRTVCGCPSLTNATKRRRCPVGSCIGSCGNGAPLNARHFFTLILRHPAELMELPNGTQTHLSISKWESPCLV